MLKMIKGADVPKAEQLKEEYILENKRITANVNTDKIRNIMEQFLNMNEDTPLFLFIETPCNISEENITGETEDGFLEMETHHKEIWYLDGIPAQTVRQIFDCVFDILLHDGLSAFGIGNPDGEEIGKYKYNIVQMFCSDAHVSRYVQFFENEGIHQTANLITAWDTFTQDEPGTCSRYESPSGMNIYDVVKCLKNY